MEWLEAHPLPAECQGCKEEDCYNCDQAGKRWHLSEAEELRVRRASLVKAIARLQRQIDDIDRALALLEDSMEEPNGPMTQELWEHCLTVCIINDDIEQYNKLWNGYPDLAANMMREFEEVVVQSNYHVTEEEKRARWERFKARMRAEHGEDFI